MYNRDMSSIDHDKALADIERDGFTIIRNFLPQEVFEEYRLECAKQFETAPHLEGKVYVPGKTPDYVQPWVINTDRHEIASSRLYQFYHNKHSANTQTIVDAVLSVRDKIEEKWPEIQDYNRRNGLVDYNIIANYAPTCGFLNKHRDAEAELSHPALQCEFLLTEPGVDYLGGDLILHLLDGRRVSTNDLLPHVGDAIFFDKRVAHEVTETRPSENKLAKGRWMALIGAKTFVRKKRSFLMDQRVKITRYMFLSMPTLYNFLKKLLK